MMPYWAVAALVIVAFVKGMETGVIARSRGYLKGWD